jgi:hypothetical protein
MARIVIALDPGTASAAGLELVRHLSQDSGAELLGVLIEDVAVLEHAQSHLAREVLLSGVERQLEAAVLEKQIRAQAASARARFEQLARRLGLRHGFLAARGEMIGELIKSASGAQTLVVDVRTIHQHVSFSASIKRLIAARMPALLFAKERWTQGSGILAIVEDETGAEAVLGAALRIGASSRSPVTVLVPTAGEEAADALLGKVAAICATHGCNVDHVVAADVALADSIVRAAAQARAGLLVMQRREDGQEAVLVAELLDRTASSLLLVS